MILRCLFSQDFVCDAYDAALFCASMNGFADVVRLLLSLTTADPLEPKGVTKYYSDTALRAATARGHAEVVALLLGDARTHALSDGNVADLLFMAVEFGYVEIFRLVISRMKFLRWSKCIEKVIETVFRRGHLSILKEICSNHGVDVNHKVQDFDYDLAELISRSR